jgi:hypothetical protein
LIFWKVYIYANTYSYYAWTVKIVGFFYYLTGLCLNGISTARLPREWFGPPWH